MTSQWTKSIDIDLGGGKVQAVVMVPLESVQLVDRKRDDGADLMRGYRSPPKVTPTPRPGEPQTP